MDLSLDQDQKLLEDSVARFLADNYSFEQRNRWKDEPSGFNAEYWKQYAELGWLALPFGEEDGGLGFTAVETMVVLQQFGKALVLEPYLSTVVLGGGFLRRLDSPLRQERIQAVIAGECHCAFACAEPGQSRFDLTAIALPAHKSSNSWKLTGDKTVVLDGQAADLFIVAARTSGKAGDAKGISLFAVDAASPGLERRAYRTLDDGRAVELSLNGVEVSSDALIGEEGEGLQLAEEVLAEAILGLGAQAVGCMDVMHADTLEYSRTREQFGVPIGTFQVLQHRLVDMFMEVEQSRSILFMAAVRTAQGGREAQRAASALKAKTGTAGRFVAQQAVQTHGGMGVTDELRLSHYFRRLTAIEQTFGNTDHHMKRFAALS